MNAAISVFKRIIIHSHLILTMMKKLEDYPSSEVSLQKKPSKQNEEEEPLVTCGEAFQNDWTNQIITFH